MLTGRRTGMRNGSKETRIDPGKRLNHLGGLDQIERGIHAMVRSEGRSNGYLRKRERGEKKREAGSFGR